MISHWAKPILALHFLTLLPTASALSAYLYGSDQDFTTDLGAPAVCNVTLNSPINDCGEAILTGPNERRFSVEELDEICTASCLTELQRYRTQILSDCDGWVIVDDTTTWAYSPSMAVDEAIYTRELACVRDNAGGYCRIIGDTTQAVLGSVGVSAFSSNRTVENLSANATTATSATANPSNSADVDINIRGIRNRRRKRAFGMHHTHAKHRRAQPEKRQEEEPDPSQGVELDFCHECVLKNLQVQVNSPFGYGSDIVSIFQSATSSCSSTQYPWTTPTSVALNGTIAVPTPAPCSGTTITLAGTETCQDISTTYNISTHDLLESNGLKGSCLDFPTEGTLCLPEGSSCGVHTVLETDTCEGISAAYGISFVKLLSWNPQINSFCSNLAQNVGFMICVTNPRGTFVQATVTEKPAQITTASTAVPVPTDTAPQVNPQCGRYHFVVEGEYCALLMVKYSISLEDFLFLNPSVNGNCTDLWANASYCVLPVGQITTYSGHPLSPLPTPTGPAITTIDFDSIPTEIPDSEFTIPPRPMYTPLPLQNGTRQDCSNYRGSSNANTIITCDGIVDYYAVSMEDLLLWNPELEGKDPCVFENGKRYCARLIAWDGTYPGPMYFGKHQLPLSIKLTLLGARKESQTPDVNVRKPIPAPGPVQEGVVDPCMTWWQNMPGDTCDVLLAIANLSFDRFFLWNPAVLSDCSNLWTNTWYCIWGPDYNGEDQYPTPTTTDPTITDTPTPTGSPTPPAQTREGEVEGCTQWHVIAENDTCATFLPTYSITIAQFYAWNPTANADCSGVWLGYAYCVAVGSTSSTPTITSTPTTTTTTPSPPAQTRDGQVEGCTQWHVIAENDTCAAFLPTYSITIAQFYAWNPTANADCSGVWLGYAYCVAVGSTSSAPITTPTTPTTSAPASGTGAPAPTQPGINANCNRWYVAVENGPGCYDISANVGITLENFYLWNPALNGDCSGLWAGYAYCTGVSA